MSKMWKIKFIYPLLIIICYAFSSVDHNPLNNGSTLSKNAGGTSFDGPLHNPALLGTERPPTGGMTLPAAMFGVGVWSDKFALSPFNKYWGESPREFSSLITKIMDNSFGLKGLSPDEVSDKLTKELKNGVTFYAGYKHSLLNFGWKYVGFDITTHAEEEMKIPGGPFLLIFSRDKGLLPGNTLDLSKFRQDAIWATDFTFSLGLPVNIPVLHDIFKLKFGAGGVGIKYVMGHSALRATTESGKVYYNENTNSLEVDGEVTIRTAGMGFSGPWRWNNLFLDRWVPPISGHGIGADIGGILYDENGSLTINFSNIGVIFWVNDVKEVTYKIKKEDLDIYDIISGVEEAKKNDEDPTLYIFNRNKNEYISNENDTLRDVSGFVSWLPVTLNIGYSYRWDFSTVKPAGLRVLADYAIAAINYEQALAKTPGRRFIPRISLGGEAGVLGGFLPIRLGYVFGGSEMIASALGASINLRYFSINASYKAVGSPIFLPTRGVELAASVNVNWGMSTDKDKDGIKDKKDKCPTEPEDKDGFEDEDGCPDLDNDKDGIVDSVDKCPMEPEDMDNFKDEDGCPDSDNDEDGTMDSIDKCPLVAEDKDGFEDEDGCPEFDNDRDGIPDSLDQCKNEPEVFNGYKDDDGCPDSLIRPSEKEEKILNTKLQAINFKSGSAELLPSSFAALDYIAEFLKKYETLRYEIQGHTDNIGSDEYNLLLSAARASTVRLYLMSKGIPEERIIAIGYGETMPIADNKTSKGRAQNRRVEFKIIETNEEYSELKTRESEFKEKIKQAKIKGAQY